MKCTVLQSSDVGKRDICNEMVPEVSFTGRSPPFVPSVQTSIVEHEE